MFLYFNSENAYILLPKRPSTSFGANHTLGSLLIIKTKTIYQSLIIA